MRRICAATIALIFTGLIFAHAEQADSTRTYPLEAISVTGSRVPLQLGQSARMVTVLDSVAIASMPAQTINDVLKYAIGVDVRQRGGLGMQTDISIRGGTYDQIAILLNGINISDPHTGHNAADFPVDMSEIDRIEILEGPAARAYGTSSLVGAINIVTRSGAARLTEGSSEATPYGGPVPTGLTGVSATDGTRSTVSVHAEGGSYGFFNGGARIGLTSGRFDHSISGNWSRSDGYSRTLTTDGSKGSLNSDFRSLKSFYQGAYHSSTADVNWQAGITAKGYGSNTFYSAKYDDQYESTLKTFLAVQAETGGFFHFKPSVYWNYSRDRFEMIRGDDSAVAFNHHRTNVFGLNLGAYMETVLGKTAFGAEMRVEDIISTNLGDSLGTAVKVPGYDACYKAGLNRTNISYYLEHNIVLDRFTLSAGAIASKNTGNEAGFGIYPGVDVSWRFAPAWKVYASYNSSLRQPTFTELYYSVGGHLADKYLKPERMQSVEGGLKYMITGLTAIVSVYYHHGTDMIDWIKDLSEGDDAVWTSVNHTEINTFGQEFSLRFDFPAMLGRKDFFVQNLSLGYSHISQDKDLEENIESQYALEYLRNKVVAQTDLHLWDRLYLNISWTWKDRVGSYEKYEGKTSTGESVAFEPYHLLDSRLSWNATRWRIYLEANNLLDKTYYDHGNIPQPGLWLRAGVSFTLGL